MSARLAKLIVVVAGMLMLAGFRGAVGQVVAADAPDQPQNDGASVPAEETRPPGPSKQPAPSSQRGRSNVAEINPSGGKKTTHAASPEAKEVIVTGVGTDPEKAMQNAFSQAIEQTVGLLVDAETVVKNDQLIRDEVLTYSRGYMEKYEVVKRWQEDGLHHATIRAVVARDKLAEKLKGMKIAVHEVAGDLASRQIDFDAKNEEQAAEMFKKALADFDMTKLTKVEIVGKPEITREGANAKVRIKVKLSPDREQWKEFTRGVRLILDKTATKRAAVTVRCGGAGQQKLILKGKHGEHEASKQLKRQLDGQGVLVGLFVNTNISGEHIQWEVFRVPDPMDGAIKVIASGLHYRLAYILSDEKGEEVVRTNEPVTSDRLLGRTSVVELNVLTNHSQYPLDRIWWIGPVWQWNGHFVPVLEMENTLSLSQEDLGKVAKTAVFLEEDSKHDKRSSATRRSAHSSSGSDADKASHKRKE